MPRQAQHIRLVVKNLHNTQHIKLTTIRRMQAYSESPKPSLYEPAAIETFAARLLKLAERIITMYIIRYGLLSGAAGGAIGSFASTSIDGAAVGLFIGAALGALVGFGEGERRAFKLKLEAQRALCMLQIEKNTRP